MTHVDSVSADLQLATPEGERISLASVAGDGLTVVQLVRYFGCLPCQDWLTQLHGAAPRLAELGVGVAAVGGSADYQARWLRDERGVTMPLLLDPEHEFRAAVSAEQRLGLKLLNPRGAAAYARSLRNGFRPQKITRDTVQAPGVVILDGDLNVVWRYVGERIGDYPALAHVESEARRLASAAA